MCRSASKGRAGADSVARPCPGSWRVRRPHKDGCARPSNAAPPHTVGLTNRSLSLGKPAHDNCGLQIEELVTKVVA
ncbi:hypothetical protein HEK616_79900 (plasmid) [Streptomyces nigrescens]|uniref:Uncharacterized protein n=1 Tax=Streptomyces nigrescens TaxID=1920 RepID=A0ABM8A7K4_STRNI|nr:hypothetical protein HEK616_79900 [Streptomyces nigrescens]